MKREAKKQKPRRAAAASGSPRCGLCGKTANLTRTECCGNWICDDEHKYQLFSYARNSCNRNHSRYTLCASHFNEGHGGRWQDCEKCRAGFDTEMFVWYATNEYNFERLENPPTFEPTLCAGCGRTIKRSVEGHMFSGGKFYCEQCTAAKHQTLQGRPEKRRR